MRLHDCRFEIRVENFKKYVKIIIAVKNTALMFIKEWKGAKSPFPFCVSDLSGTYVNKCNNFCKLRYMFENMWNEEHVYTNFINGIRHCNGLATEEKAE